MALLILSPEGLGALKAVLNNRVQRAMNLFFGSVLATISLTVPVVTLIAFMTGNELQFALGAPEMVVMASLVLCHISFSTGRTNVLNGAAHLALFAAYLMTIFADSYISSDDGNRGDNINPAYCISSYYRTGR